MECEESATWCNIGAALVLMACTGSCKREKSVATVRKAKYWLISYATCCCSWPQAWGRRKVGRTFARISTSPSMAPTTTSKCVPPGFSWAFISITNKKQQLLNKWFGCFWIQHDSATLEVLKQSLRLKVYTLRWVEQTDDAAKCKLAIHSKPYPVEVNIRIWIIPAKMDWT